MPKLLQKIEVDHFFFGRVQYFKGNLEGAKLSLERAIELDPNDGAAQRLLGSVLEDMGDLCGAERCFRRAIEINPEEGVAHCAFSRPTATSKVRSGVSEGR